MGKQLENDKHSICIALLKAGDSRMFTRFVREFQDMVFACCRMMGLSELDTEDAASETFLAAWQSIGKFNEKSKLSSWLWSIAYHKAVDYRRKKSSGKALDETIDTIPTPQTTSPEGLENMEQQQRLWAAVQQLPIPQAAAIVLYYRESKSIDEIAHILEMPENTVKTHLHRGRKELYNQLHAVWENDYVKKY